ncbi:MAG: response regulator [Lachnospiraceae bacterium]|nr:response regulator [Lachnospiraceae bacterium]
MNWVVVVDDEDFNRKTVARILKKHDFIVTALASGPELLDFLFVKGNTPDLILLDIKMPQMDGFDTMKRLQELLPEEHRIPIVFLTGDTVDETEMKGLRMGAEDFIRKPIYPDVLLHRVNRIIELDRTHKSMAQEIQARSAECESLSRHVVQTLAEAIDAKDTYTNGHSDRVATYSREIAKRYGYSESAQNDIYMMGLLHDVGKIGVPDEIINKPGKLTDEEFAAIKSHPVIGDRILKKVKEMPKLSIGARWHHERYDGRGYPDGLKGEEILEEARIIAVADAYDAMTSHRSYRDILPQEVVRGEIEKGKGSQFDPVFADIMLQMIDEDKEYLMHEE